MTGLDPEFAGRLKSDLFHRVRPMPGHGTGGDRSASPLELLYDLVYVIAFGVAAEQLGHALGGSTPLPAIGAYLFAIFGVTWAWMNFTWFASAYGNDDVLFRIATIVQMIGAIVFTFGLPLSFAAAEEGGSPNNGIMVVGYVIMRVPLVLLWLRASREDPKRSQTAVGYAVIIAIAQAGWVLTAVVPFPVPVIVGGLVLLALAELIAPVILERNFGRAPWNAGHIAERFGLLTLITLGEVVASTTTTVGALVTSEGWSLPAFVIVAAGIVLTASLWWAYFLIPSRTLLERWPRRVWAWRYAHLPMFGAIAAVGAGLHLAASTLDEGHGSALTVALALGVPVAAVIVMVYATWSILVRSFDWAHLPMLALCLLPLAASLVVAAVADTEESISIGVLVSVVALVALSTIVEVIVHERVGYRHTISALEASRVRGRLG